MKQKIPELFLQKIDYIEKNNPILLPKTPSLQARDFVSQESLVQSTQKRAALEILQEQEDELLLSLYFSSELIESICEDKIIHKPNHKNLDQLTVLVEEISHFHFFINRAYQKRQCSVLELELQAELDKFLVSYILTKNKYKKHYGKEIAYLLYENPNNKILKTEPYHEANRRAAQFWYYWLTQGFGKKFDHLEGFFRTLMCRNYQASLQERKICLVS